MGNDRVHEVLNELLRLQMRSLPQYLESTSFWAERGEQQAKDAVSRIVEDQRQMGQRIAKLIESRGKTVSAGEFSMSYTDLHFLSIDYLLKRIMEEQQRDIPVIENMAAELSDDQEARTLVEEVLGSEKAHLESLEELVAIHAR